MSGKGLRWSGAPQVLCSLMGREGGLGASNGFAEGSILLAVSCVPIVGHYTNLVGCYLHFKNQEENSLVVQWLGLPRFHY